MKYTNEKNNKYVEVEEKLGGTLPSLFFLIAIIGVVIFLYLYKDQILNEFKTEMKYSYKDSDIVLNENFVSGMRLASLGRYDEAVAYFEKLKFDSLTVDDKEIVLYSYIEANQAQKAIDLHDEFDRHIVNIYLKNNQMDRLNELQTESELIKFEVAVIENDYKTIIALKDIAELEIDSRRASAIANAYYQLGDKEEALDFTSLMVLNGINIWKEQQGSSPFTQSQKPRTNAGSSINYLIVIVSIGVIAISLVMIRRRMKRNRNENGEESIETKTLTKETMKKKSPLIRRKKKETQDEIEQAVARKPDDSASDSMDESEVSIDLFAEDKTEDKYSYHFED